MKLKKLLSLCVGVSSLLLLQACWSKDDNKDSILFFNGLIDEAILESGSVTFKQINGSPILAVCMFVRADSFSFSAHEAYEEWLNENKTESNYLTNGVLPRRDYGVITLVKAEHKTFTYWLKNSYLEHNREKIFFRNYKNDDGQVVPCFKQPIDYQIENTRYDKYLTFKGGTTQ